MSLSDSALLLALALERFAERSSWKEGELARRLGTRTNLQRVLAVLAEQGWPLHLQDGVWSVPEGWRPDGLRLSTTDLSELLRILARAPRSRPRDQILSKLTRRLRESSRVAPSELEPPDEYRAALEQAATERRALEILYFSRETFAAAPRTVSVQDSASWGRGECWVVSHPSNTATRILLDGVLDVRERPDRAYVLAEGLRRASRAVPRLRVAFRVPHRKTRQLLPNLTAGLGVRGDDDGLHVEGRVSGLMPVARLVLTLGAGIAIETPELRGLVDALARLATGELGFEPQPPPLTLGVPPGS